MRIIILSVLFSLCLVARVGAQTAAITQHGSSWTLQNPQLSVTLAFRNGSLSLNGLTNRATGRNLLAGRATMPLFSHTVAGAVCAADDGHWMLSGSSISPVTLFSKTWGQRLQVTLNRTAPGAFSVRQVVEIYDGGGGLRVSSFLKNRTDQPLTITTSDVLGLDLPEAPHELIFVPKMFRWTSTDGGLTGGGRGAIVRYDTGDGWFIVPENNWATSLTEGQNKGDPAEKFLKLDIWNGLPGARVATNPRAVQLTLFPREEVEYFAVNLGVFAGDLLDGRIAAAEHLRKRYKFVNTAPTLSINDWQWGACQCKRTDANYRNIVIPRAAAAGFDRVNIDAEWYTEDGVDPVNHWTNMASLCDLIVAGGMKPGHWFPLQGKGGSCGLCWYDGHGRDAADPANIDFKLKQTQETLIGKYQSAWGQLDCGLLWRTDKETPYSHPADSVYRKLLGMRRYASTITQEHPDYLMHMTCEVDNPGTTSEAQNVGLIHLCDNGIIGSFRRTENGDDVRDLFDSVGTFPLEGELSTPGEDGNMGRAWQDSPLWYYQFLLARHTSVYSWPGDWSPESIVRLRVFNDWRRNPRILALLGELRRPVYSGPDWLKNEGPWCWSFIDPTKSRALVFAINHLGLNQNNAFAAKLRGLEPGKTYLVEEITQAPDASFHYGFRGAFTGAQLKAEGFPVNLDANEEPCAAFWLQEKTNARAQVLYADAAVTSWTERWTRGALQVALLGKPGATSHLVIHKQGGVEERGVVLDTAGKATAVFNSSAITQKAAPMTPASPQPATAIFAGRDVSTAGAWTGLYGKTAAWIAGSPFARQIKEFGFHTAAETFVWGDDKDTARVLAAPAGQSRRAACWTAAETFTMQITPPANDSRPYRLSVYLMDYDIRTPAWARAMELSLLDTSGGVLDTRNVTTTEMARGVYLTWTITGKVKIQARKTAGINAVVSGVFVDEVR